MFWRDLGFTQFIRYVHSDRSHLLRYWDFMVAYGSSHLRDWTGRALAASISFRIYLLHPNEKHER